jgi:hypothetical protein
MVSALSVRAVYLPLHSTCRSKFFSSSSPNIYIHSTRLTIITPQPDRRHGASLLPPPIPPPPLLRHWAQAQRLPAVLPLRRRLVVLPGREPYGSRCRAQQAICSSKRTLACCLHIVYSLHRIWESDSCWTEQATRCMVQAIYACLVGCQEIIMFDSI